MIGTTAGDRNSRRAEGSGLFLNHHVPTQLAPAATRLLPLDQWATLLETTLDPLLHFLQVEEMANWVILGGFKPDWAPVRYTTPDAQTRKRGESIKPIVKAHFGDELQQAGEPRFAFVQPLSQPRQTGVVPRSEAALVRTAFVCSYLKVLGDPLSNPHAGAVCPEGLLQRLAEVGAEMPGVGNGLCTSRPAVRHGLTEGLAHKFREVPAWLACLPSPPPRIRRFRRLLARAERTRTSSVRRTWRWLGLFCRFGARKAFQAQGEDLGIEPGQAAQDGFDLIHQDDRLEWSGLGGTGFRQPLPAGGFSSLRSIALGGRAPACLAADLASVMCTSNCHSSPESWMWNSPRRMRRKNVQEHGLHDIFSVHAAHQAFTQVLAGQGGKLVGRTISNNCRAASASPLRQTEEDIGGSRILVRRFPSPPSPVRSVIPWPGKRAAARRDDLP